MNESIEIGIPASQIDGIDKSTVGTELVTSI